MPLEPLYYFYIPPGLLIVHVVTKGHKPWCRERLKFLFRDTGGMKRRCL